MESDPCNCSGSRMARRSMLSVRAMLRALVPVAILMAVTGLFCVYVLVIDDYDADTGAIVTRFFGCLGAQLAAVGVGSFIAARRALTHRRQLGMFAGCAGALTLATLLTLAGSDVRTIVDPLTVTFLIAGIMLSAIGSGLATRQ